MFNIQLKPLILPGKLLEQQAALWKLSNQTTNELQIHGTPKDQFNRIEVQQH